MKKLFSFVFAVCFGMSLSAGTWLETFGTSVEKNGNGYWPYTTDYSGYDHLSDGVAYGGWNATVRYVGSFDSYGPHVFLAASKEAYLTIDGIPGNNNCEISFDIVGYGSEVNISDVLQFYVNEEEISLGTVTVPTDGFKTVSVPGKYSAEYLNLKWYHTSSVSAQLRIDNVKVTWPEPVAAYYLSVSAGEGGSVTNVNGTYSKGTVVTILATPDDGYEFVEWSDGVTTNPRNVEITKDITLQAIFEAVVVSDCVYPELEGLKGSEILNVLYSKINSHTVLSYADVRADKAGVDFRSNGTVWDMYSDCSFYSSDYCSAGEHPDCECYNREHSVPKSFWGGSTDEPMYTDLHHILPTDYAANSTRSAWVYGEVDGSVTWSNNLSKFGYSSSYGTTVFEPADEYKGDIARIYFYMLTCYKNVDFTQGGQGYRVFDYSGSTSTFTSTAKAMFLKWHRNDPVSQKEIDRNNAVAKKQGNRNPFVDAPELAEYIWGKKTSTAYTCTTIEPEPPIGDETTIWEENLSTRRGSTYIVKAKTSFGEAWPYANQWFTGYEATDASNNVVGNQYDNDYDNVTSYTVSIRNKKLNGSSESEVGLFFGFGKEADKNYVLFEGNIISAKSDAVLHFEICSPESDGGDLSTMIVRVNGNDLSVPETTLGSQLVTSNVAIALPNAAINSIYIAFDNVPSQKFISKMWITSDEVPTPVTTYTITVKANDDSKGYVYGSGTYEKGQTIAISATPYLGYQFEKWDDGNTANPRYVSVTADHTYTAIFSTATPTPVGDPITVQLDPSSASWSDVGLYAWLTDKDGNVVNSAVLGDWPGTKVSKDATTGWWSFTFPEAYSDVLHIIWNNADGSEQTIDIDDVTENTCYQIGEFLETLSWGPKKYDCVVVDCPTGPTPTYEITFVNYDGTVLDRREWSEGATPTCSEPSKPDDDYFYCFTGWNPSVVPVTKAATYQAQYRICGGWITEGQTYWWLESNILYIIGNGVIPDYAEGAVPWMPYVNDINAVYVDNGITRIGEWAFADMHITAVQIQADVTAIGANAFKGSESIANVYYEGYDYQWVAINFVNEYANPLIYGAALYAKEGEVTTVTVSQTTEEVSAGAFVGMSTVSYEGTIEQWCEMTFTPAVESTYEPSYDLVINGQIVQNPCFGEGLKQINAYAFRGCKSIESICIPASLLQIGADAFKSTPNLNKVLYAGSLAQWCNITFANAEANPSCHADLYISNDKLGNTLDIPASITTINAFAFPNTKTLNVYFYNSNPAGYALNSFGTPANVGNKHFYVPCGTKAAYQSKLNYAEELFGEHYIHIYAVLSDNVEQGTVNVLHQPTCDEPELVVKAIANPAYRFVEWSNGSKDEELTLTLSGDITLTAFFELDQFTVRFLMDDGTPLSEQLLTYGQMPVIVADPEKEPTAQYTYTFKGWDKEIVPATASVDYIAVFDATVNKYMVYFIDWNGELLSEQEVPYGSAASEPAVSAREGYTFNGWSVDVKFIVGRTFAVAQYKPITEGDYPVRFSNNVDNTEIDVENIDLHFPDAPYIEGFVFVGWKPVCDEFIASGMEIQAIYEPSQPSSAEVVVNPANQAQKLIREGNLYILQDGKTYTATGAKVK